MLWPDLAGKMRYKMPLLLGRWGALALVFFLLLLPSRLVQAQMPLVNLIEQSAWWADPTGKAELPQARVQNYIDYDGVLNRGYVSSTTWIRLTFAPSETPVGLNISPSWLDQLTVYDPARNNQPLHAGDKNPLGFDAATNELGYTFRLPVSDVRRDIFIRLASSSTHRVIIKAMPIEDLSLYKGYEMAWVSLHAAVSMAMLLLLLGIWAVQRDTVLGAFLVRHINYTFYGMAYLGLPHVLLGHNLAVLSVLNTAFSVSILFMMTLGLWFDIALLSSYNPNRYLLRIMKGFMWGGMAMLGVYVAGYPHLALQFAVLSILLAAPFMFATAVSVRPDTVVEWLMPKRILVGYYTFILTSLFIGLSSVLGWMQAYGWSQYLLIIHGLVSGLIMSTILIVRGQRTLEFTRQMGWKLQISQLNMEMERRRRDEQSHLLNMLMHELKTPLSVVSLALVTRNRREENLERASRAVQEMKAIIDQSVQADQLGHLTLACHNDMVSLSEVIGSLVRDSPMLSDRLMLNLSENLDSLHTDRQLLRTIINNIIDNAVNYSEIGSDVRLDVKRIERDGVPGVSICVLNRPGQAGWPDVSKLFTKYYRANGALRESGSGLGLYLSRELAQALGGTLDYTPFEGHIGFTLWIPCIPASALS